MYDLINKKRKLNNESLSMLLCLIFPLINV